MAGSFDEKNDGLGRKKSVLRKTDVLGAGWESRLEEARARRAKALEGKSQPEPTEPQKPWEARAVTELPPLIDEETGRETDAPDLSLLGIQPKEAPDLPPPPSQDEIDAAIAAARAARIETKTRLDFEDTGKADAPVVPPVPRDAAPLIDEGAGSQETMRRLSVVEAVAPPEEEHVAWADRVKEAEEINEASKPVIDAPLVEEEEPEEPIVEVTGVRWELVAAAVLLLATPIAAYGLFMRDGGSVSVAQSGTEAVEVTAALAPVEVEMPEVEPVETAAVAPVVEEPEAEEPEVQEPVAAAPEPEPVTEEVAPVSQPVQEEQVATVELPASAMVAVVESGDGLFVVDVQEADPGQIHPRPRGDVSPELLAALTATDPVEPALTETEQPGPTLVVLQAEDDQIHPKPRGEVPSDVLAALTTLAPDASGTEGAAEAILSDTAPTVDAKTGALAVLASLDTQGVPSFPVVQPSPDQKPGGSADRALAVKGPAPADLLPNVAAPLGRGPQSMRSASGVDSVVRLAAIAPTIGFDAVLPEVRDRSKVSTLSSRQDGALQPAEPRLPRRFTAPFDLGVLVGSTDPVRPDQTRIADQALVVASLAPAPAQIAAPKRIEQIVPALSGPGIELLPPSPPKPDTSDAAVLEPGAPVIYLHAAVTADADEVGKVMASVSDVTGFPARTTPPFDFKISQTQVRFFHPEDREAASKVADAMSARLRSFTNFDPKPPQGTIELWLAGGGKAAARASAPKVALKKPAAPKRTAPKRQAQRAAPPPQKKIEATTIIRKRPSGLGKIFGGSGG